MLPILILAGGLATRLRPITKEIPKALLEINGKPFIQYQLEYIREQGIEEVVICTGYLGQMIKDFSKDGSKYGLKIFYSGDGDKLLGTGGAVKKAINLIDRNFFVLYGDSYLPIKFKKVQDAFFNSNKLALMTVLKNKNEWDRSNVFFDKNIVQEYNKKKPNPEMKFIDYGLSILSKSVFENYPSEVSFDLSDVFYQLSINGKLAGHEVNERFYEIGSFSGIKETEIFFNKKKGNNELRRTAS